MCHCAPVFRIHSTASNTWRAGTGLRPGRPSGMFSSGKYSRIRSQCSSLNRCIFTIVDNELHISTEFEIGSRLIVAVRPGPTTWFPGPQGSPSGFDHDLIARYAEERKLPLTVIEVDSAATLIAKVAAGEVHLGVGGLHAPSPSAKQPDAAIADPWPVLWTSGHYAVEPVLI